MQISPSGIALIESFEGFAAQIYNDAGKPAVGYGHDLRPGEAARYADGVTRDEAEALLVQDLEPVQTALESLVPASCTQNQWDALCSFGYNLGVGSLKTMLGHGWDQVPAQMVRWCHLNGVVSPGLTARREKEAQLFNS